MFAVGRMLCYSSWGLLVRGVCTGQVSLLKFDVGVQIAVILLGLVLFFQAFLGVEYSRKLYWQH